MTVIPIVIDALGTIPKELVKGLEYLEIRGQGGYHPDNSIIKIGQNSEKNPGTWGRLITSMSSQCEKTSKE